ncbi:MAG: DUF4156 domain-containing protein [Gammaproteobacteria bacterium]|nr:DUF4156 domain-containing protein [Gammaproteobacteria bacterium]
MNTLLKNILVILVSVLISSCAPVQLHSDNKPVRLIFYNEVNLTKTTPDCEYIGPIVSSYGRWYNYLFISNTGLTNGAIDDMYNKANEVGANVIYINKNIDFVTSVTLLGQAYNCKQLDTHTLEKSLLRQRI